MLYRDLPGAFVDAETDRTIIILSSTSQWWYYVNEGNRIIIFKSFLGHRTVVVHVRDNQSATFNILYIIL